MIFVMVALVILATGMVGYALFETFKSQAKTVKKKKDQIIATAKEPDQQAEQRVQHLQHHIAELEDKLKKEELEFNKEKAEVAVARDNEVKFSDELKRREEWVAKAEERVAKIKEENSDLSDKFISKEKELAEEFAKGVNLSREIREIKSALEAKEMACRLKEDQIQAQAHQIESHIKKIKEQENLISEFKQKEKISEWVPKAEFNRLNQEYSQLEKELEASEERLKNFAEEIAHLPKASAMPVDVNAGQNKEKEGEKPVI